MPGFNLSEYEPVEDRIREFWEQHPEGRIVTELVYHRESDFIFRAEVYRLPPVVGATMQNGVQFPDATGYAHDSADSLPASMKSSALEVCETSAIGRALANLGYAAKGKRPSREEMTKSGAGAHASSKPEPSDLAVSGSGAPLQQPEAHTGGKPSTATSTAAETSDGAGEAVSGEPASSEPSPGEGGGAVGDDTPLPSSVETKHAHVWVDSPKLSKYEICAVDGCYETRKKAAA